MVQSAERPVPGLLPSGRYRKWIVAAVLLGAAVRAGVCVYLYARGATYADEASYWHVGQRIRAGHGISMAYDLMGGIIRADEPTAFWGFLFNVIVAGLQALFHENLLACRLTLGLVAWFVTALGTLGLARGALSPFQTFLAVLGLALYPNLHFVAAFLMTEVVMAPLVVVALWGGRAVSSVRGATLAGAAFGLMHLTKATMLGFQVLYMGAIAWGQRSRRVWTNLAWMGVVTLALFGPWVVRNGIHYGRFVVETKSGFNLWLFNNPHHTKPFWKEDFAGGLDTISFEPGLNEPQRNDRYRRLFLEFLLERPGTFARLCVSRFLNVWSLSPIYMSVAPWEKALIVAFNALLYACLVGGMFISLRSRVLQECTGAVIYLSTALTLTTASFRQRSYVDACIVILAAIAVSTVLARWWPRLASEMTRAAARRDTRRGGLDQPQARTASR